MTAIDRHLKNGESGSEKPCCAADEQKNQQPIKHQSEQRSEFVRTENLQRQEIVRLVREIDTLRQPDYQELIRLLETLLIRLLQYRYSPALLSCRQEQQIVESRSELIHQLVDKSFLNTYFGHALQIAYGNARHTVRRETGSALDTFPERCPFLPEQVLDQNFLPTHYPG
jgi:hypothetical protein